MTSDQGQAQPRTLRVDVLGGLVLLAVGLTFRLASGSGSMNWLMPVALTDFLMAVGGYLIVRSLLRRGATVALRRPDRHSPGADVAVFLVIAATYVVLAPFAGFWLTSALMLFGCSMLFAPQRDRRAALISAATALGICAVFYVLMLHVFYVPLPEGEWLPL
ncbi:MAG: tripartite tricarboxylate transporter TctB family protein [Actinomycetes bacterium]